MTTLTFPAASVTLIVLNSFFVTASVCSCEAGKPATEGDVMLISDRIVALEAEIVQRQW
jgi:hypothetical protein